MKRRTVEGTPGLDDVRLLKIAAVAASAAREAGESSLRILREGFEVDYKSDRSPVTAADLEADRRIRDILEGSAATGSIPVVSEEGDLPDPAIREGWEEYLLVDPLDGTRGFVERGDEFTVNIALMRRETPALGVIAIPLTGLIYLGGAGFPSRRLEVSMDPGTAAPARIEARIGEEHIVNAFRLPQKATDHPQIVASRNNLDRETKAWIERLSAREPFRTAHPKIVQAGSAAKFALIAEQSAAVYPRFAPCMEWDTAAGVALVRGSGGEVFDAKSRKQLTYGAADWHSRPFVAWSSAALRSRAGPSW